MQMELRERHSEAEITATEGSADSASADALNKQSYRVSAEIAQERPLNHQEEQNYRYHRVETV
jgi:hypothetical protein